MLLGPFPCHNSSGTLPGHSLAPAEHSNKKTPEHWALTQSQKSDLLCWFWGCQTWAAAPQWLALRCNPPLWWWQTPAAGSAPRSSGTGRRLSVATRSTRGASRALLQPQEKGTAKDDTLKCLWGDYPAPITNTWQHWSSSTSILRGDRFLPWY